MDRNGSKWNKNELILHILKYFVNQEFSLSSSVKWMRLSLLTQSEEQAASAKKIYILHTQNEKLQVHCMDLGTQKDPIS